MDQEINVTLADLKRELADLMKAIAEDNDGQGRDHLLNGRWPVAHNLARRIHKMETGVWL